jgi:ABC-2 type transport system ATP-binding protein
VDQKEHTIEVENLFKRFGRLEAVAGISFKVEKGQIFGFLGPNGAGKSTTMRILTGYTQATSGIARICGFSVASEPHEIKRRIGYMPENNPLPLELRVREYLKWRARLKELPLHHRSKRVDEVMERCDLTRARDRIIGKLSKGFRQRVGIADAILAHPEVIIMDEPTIGLDPHQVIMIRDLIASLRGKMSVIISSHILPEIEMTCDQVIIINGGKIVGKGTPNELRETFIDSTTYELEINGDLGDLLESLKNVASNLEVAQYAEADERGFSRVAIRIPGQHDCGEKLFSCLSDNPLIRTRSLKMREAPLEDVFLAATRRSWETLDSDLTKKPESIAPETEEKEVSAAGQQ